MSTVVGYQAGVCRALWAVAAAAIASGGCDSMRAGANPDVPAWTHRAAGVLDVVYTRRVVAEMRHHGEPYQRGRIEVDAQRKRLFVGSSDHGLYALAAVDGHQLWRFETAGPVQSEPLYDDGANTLYFGSNDGALYKVDADTGRLLWRFSTNSEVSRRPVLDSGWVYFTNANDSVLALDAETGKQRWVQHRSPALGMEIAGHSGVRLWRGNVYAGFSDGTIAAFDAKTGEDRWQPVDLSADAEAVIGNAPEYLDLDSTPETGIVDGSPVIFVATYAAGVYALDAETGAPVWSNTEVRGSTSVLAWRQPAHHGSDGAAIPERRYLIASTGTSGLWALDERSGDAIWNQDLPRGGVTAPTPYAGALLVSTSQLGLFLISALDGRVIDGLHMTSGAATVPATMGNRAFIVTNGGQLLALELALPHQTPASTVWPQQVL